MLFTRSHVLLTLGVLLPASSTVQAGYCNWGPAGTAASSTCDGQVQGGDWCNQSSQNCQGGCGGRWCDDNNAAPTGYCNWGPDGTAASSTCNGDVQGGEWCNQSSQNCQGGCGGRWCTSSGGGGDGGGGSPSACGCDACTSAVLDRIATDRSGSHSCSDRINWVQNNLGYSKKDACRLVSDEFPTVCGSGCNPDSCGGGGGGPSHPPPPPPPSPQPPSSGKTATVTRYWDCSGGACGCAYLPFGDSARPAHCYSNAMFRAPAGNPHGAKFYGTAAISQALGGGDWLAPGCGKCWKVTATSNTGVSPAFTSTVVLKGTNYCPPKNPACNGKPHFDIAAPGFDVTSFSFANTCDSREPHESEGFRSCEFWMINSSNPVENCDCSKFKDAVLRAGCENYLSLQWDNPQVTYEEVTCPFELQRLPCWAENGNNYPNGIPPLCANPNA